ncbi:hypothetical protein VSR34_36585 [Paraburkholderia sp. JHI2823]|uniref:hypothetical protein n=1 Tax=Paraburkholderia sp. JHI2823 TaxID=3112960 RepID=UPI00317B1EF0
METLLTVTSRTSFGLVGIDWNGVSWCSHSPNWFPCHLSPDGIDVVREARALDRKSDCRVGAVVTVRRLEKIDLPAFTTVGAPS